MKKEIAIAFASLVVGMLAGWMLASGILPYNGTRGLMTGKEASDTTVIYKTRIGMNVEAQTIDFSKWDITVPQLNFPDTAHAEPTIIRIRDTVKIYVPINRHYFELDEGRVRLWASGYNVSIDSWEVDERTEYIKPAFKHHRVWLGADGHINNNPRLVISANYGYTTKWGMTFIGGVGYEPIRKQFEARVGINWGFSF